MSNFLKQHLATKPVNTNCAAPPTPNYDLGEFFPPDFIHLSNRPNRIPAQPRLNRYDSTAFEVLHNYIEPTFKG